MFGLGQGRVQKALELEISRAKRFGYHVGVLILDVAESTPRGVHKSLPGLTVEVKHIRDLLRDYDTVMKTKLRRYSVILPHLGAGESAHLVRDRILFTSRLQEWGPVNVGIAIYPDNGASARDLLRFAEKDLGKSLEIQPELDEVVN
jgi:hypothetical protein